MEAPTPSTRGDDIRGLRTIASVSHVISVSTATALHHCADLCCVVATCPLSVAGCVPRAPPTSRSVGRAARTVLRGGGTRQCVPPTRRRCFVIGRRGGMCPRLRGLVFR